MLQRFQPVRDVITGVPVRVRNENACSERANEKSPVIRRKYFNKFICRTVLITLIKL